MPNRLDQTTITVNNSTKDKLYHDIMVLCSGATEPTSWDEALLFLLDLAKGVDQF